MKSKSEFESYFERKLKKATEILENYRLENLRKLKRKLIWSVIFIPFFLLSFITGHGVIIFSLILPTLVIWGLMYQQLFEMNKYLRYNYKKHVLQKAIGFYFDDFEYIERQKIAKQVLTESQLFPQYISYIEGEDFMRFTIGKVRLMFSEVAVYKGRGRIVFNGVFVVSSFNKYFSSETYVIARKSATFLQRIRKQLLKNLKEVHLEDVNFSRKFQTFSNNQTEARYILTPHMMSRLVDYSHKLKKDISLSFVQNKLFCSIPMIQDLFEPSLLKPIDLESVSKSIEPVLLFTDIVNDLELNLRIWSKS